MSKFSVGFATVNINPPLGIPIIGYYVDRYAKGFLDDLEASAIALSDGKKRIIMISVDHCLITEPNISRFISNVAKATGVSKNNVFIACTHTHTGPFSSTDTMFFGDDQTIVERYADFLGERLADVALLALNDLKRARMGYIVGNAPERVAYIRRYRMKDGSTMTCPPINDPDIVGPIGTLDQRVNVVRFDREGAESIVLVNYGVHADTVNGDMISSDWLGWLRRTVEKALDGVKCIAFVGAQGDVGSTNVHPKDGDMNDTEISFDNEMKSPGMARFVGRALAGTVLQVYDKVKYVSVDSIDAFSYIAKAPSNMPKPEELPLAHKYNDLHNSGRDDLIPYTAMELTTVVAEARRMCALEHGPEFFDINFTGVRIGDIAFLGIPGEPFTDIGVRIKENSDYSLVLPCALVNGSKGYFPVRSAYEEGGYEARSTSYKVGIDDVIVDGAKTVLDNLKSRRNK